MKKSSHYINGLAQDCSKHSVLAMGYCSFALSHRYTALILVFSLKKLITDNLYMADESKLWGISQKLISDLHFTVAIDLPLQILDSDIARL